jgi:NAD(P)H-nitrite reductase large subunit
MKREKDTFMTVDGHGRNPLCRCEEVSVEDVRDAIEQGAVTLNDVKRRTRAGMGACQGIYCVRTIAIMIAAMTGAPASTLEPMTARPPARMISLGNLAKLDDQLDEQALNAPGIR